jgi:predicted dehydrogenase/nucleoside-diphosphate-sugar epimerase
MAADILHLPAALASDLVEIVAIVDPAGNRASGLARRYGLDVEIGGTIDDIHTAIDGVIIATPNNAHKPVAAACARRGLHCLIEKPLATSTADGEEICNLQREHNVTIAVGYATRFRNSVVLLKELLDARHFGSIRRFHFQEGSVGGWGAASGFNLDRAAMGGGVLVGTGTHFLDRMLYWFGLPEECEMADDSSGGPEAHCLASVHYRRAGECFDGTICISRLFHLKTGLVIETEDGCVILEGYASPPVFRPRGSPSLEMVLRPRGTPPFPEGVSSFQLQLEDFVAACRGQRKPLVDAEQGLASLRLLEKLYANRTALAEPWRGSAAQSMALPASIRTPPSLKVGIFGASGFVGATLLERLRHRGIDTVAMIHTTGNAWRLARARTPMKLVDIRSPSEVAVAMRGCTHIVNCTRGDDATMIAGLRNLLDEARRQQIQRFVHLSSIAVYGTRPGPEAAGEDSPARPASGSYGALKLRQDELVARAHRNGLSCVVLCLPNISGVYSGFVCSVIEDIREGRFALVEGGRMPINIVDVDNVVYAIELALAAENADGSRMFITDGDDITWGHFVDQLLPLIELSEPLPTISAEAAATPGGERRRASVGRALVHLMSSEVRGALRADPLIEKCEQSARALVEWLPDRLQERLRSSLGGPVRVPKVTTQRLFQSRYMEQQLRGVVHRSQRAAQLIGYTPRIQFADSMARFRSWYTASNGIGSERWPLAKQLLH